MKKLIVLFLSGLMVVEVAFATALPMPPNATYEIGFSPKRGAQEIVISGISNAQSQVLVAAYSFSSKPIAIALLDAQKRGVKVFVVADTEQNNNSYTAVRFLANQGVPVRLNENYPSMHNKYMVIDGRSVQLGSFNYSAVAHNKNAENALLLHGVPDLAKQYAADWQLLWDGGIPVEKRY